GTRAAQPSFATPIGVEEAYCFFTQVLVNALCGVPPNVAEDHPTLGKVVANDCLLTTVERELPLLASKYNRKQTPDLQGAWRSPEHIWSVLSQLDPAKVPDFATPPEPPPSGEGVLEGGGVWKPEERAEAKAREFESALRQEVRPTHFE